MAAGYTTLLCFIICAIAHYFFMKKVVREHLGSIAIYDVRIIISLGVCLLLGAAVAMAMYQTVVLRYALVLFLSVVLIWQRRKLLALFQQLRKK